MPSCCWVCRACNLVEAKFMSASTREPIPVLVLSVRVVIVVA